ncbi:MAG: hypothetical protein KGH49_02140 [Candidatus Micrarchaeota archaeon]|nr:hypothetical protein [Candidatus Micrarchaeota archaeon]
MTGKNFTKINSSHKISNGFAYEVKGDRFTLKAVEHEGKEWKVVDPRCDQKDGANGLVRVDLYEVRRGSGQGYMVVTESFIGPFEKHFSKDWFTHSLKVAVDVLDARVRHELSKLGLSADIAEYEQICVVDGTNPARNRNSHKV